MNRTPEHEREFRNTIGLIIIIIFGLLILTGCGEPHPVPTTYCAPESSALRASFTTDCVRDANPLSDEEPEDWIRQCNQVAEELYCEPGFKYRNYRQHTISVPLPCSMAGSLDELAVCHGPNRKQESACM